MTQESEFKQVLVQVYELGLEKFAGDEAKALEFTEGFAKEAASGPQGFMSLVGKGAAGALGAGVVGAGLGMAMHGVSSALAGMKSDNMHAKFVQVLAEVRAKSALLKNAPEDKLRSYGETIFKFAPHVATDPNLLASILSNAVHGDGVDPMTIRTLGDLESRYVDGRKGALFSPKSYI